MRLTWDAVLHVLRNNPKGMTNKEMSQIFNSDLQTVTMLTLIMWKAGEVRRTARKPGTNNSMRYFA